MKPIEEKIRNHWGTIRQGFQREYADLRDEDLDYEEGREDDLLRRIEKRLDQPTAAVEEFIDKYPVPEDKRSREL